MENKYQVEFPSTNVKNIWKHYYIVVLELISIGFNLHFSFLKNIVSSEFRFSGMQNSKTWWIDVKFLFTFATKIRIIVPG